MCALWKSTRKKLRTCVTAFTNTRGSCRSKQKRSPSSRTSDTQQETYLAPSAQRYLCVRGPWTTDLPGPLPILHNLIPLTPPYIHTYSDFAYVYLYYMILSTALFNQYISHGVFWKFGSLWLRNNKWDPLIFFVFVFLSFIFFIKSRKKRKQNHK